MSPEAKDIFRKVKDLIIDDVASDKALESGMKKFLAGDITAEELQKLTRSREVLDNELEDSFTPVLEKLGLGEHDFSITVEEVERPPTIIEQIPEIAVIKPPKEKYWITNANAIIIEKLIEKENGTFIHQDFTQIGLSVLEPEYREEPWAEKRAYRRVHSYRSEFKKNIIEVNKDTKAKTMRELLFRMCTGDEGPVTGSPYDVIPDKIRKRMWKKIFDTYGNMSPDDFIKNVLYAKRTGEVEKLVPSPQKDKIRPGEVIKNPVIEIILANKFSDAQVIEKIGEKVFEGVSAEQVIEIAKKQGWQVRGKDYKKILERSCKSSAKERNNEQIDEQEGLEGQTIIMNIIQRFTRKQGRAGWHTVENASHRPAFRFLYAIMGEVGDDMSKADNLIEVLFSGFIGTITKSGQIHCKKP